MKRSFSQAFALFFALPFWVSCQTLSPKLVCRLPDTLKESSGLIVESNNAFWTINDSGDSAKLYQFDSTGRIRKVVILRGATNVDFEDLATDMQGNFYVGDFGNNAETRRNLVVYRIAKDSLRQLRTDTATTTPSVIPFRYSDQTAFPPPSDNLVFDAEALLAFDDSLFVFTKDFDSNPYRGVTKIYGFENRVTRAEQAVPLLDSFKTDASWKYNGAITAAAITPDRRKVALMSYQKLWIFTDFVGKAFWKGRKHEFSFGLDDFVQREAAAFLDSCTLYMTSERVSRSGISFGGNLTALNTCRLLTKSKDLASVAAPKISLSPNPSVSGVSIRANEILEEDLRLTIFDVTGKLLSNQTLKTGEIDWEVASDTFPSAGFYVAQVNSSKNTPLSMHKIFIVR